MLKLYSVSFDTDPGGWKSGSDYSILVVAESKEESKKIALEKEPMYKRNGVITNSREIKVEGYVIEIHDEKTFNRLKNIDKIIS